MRAIQTHQVTTVSGQSNPSPIQDHISSLELHQQEDKCFQRLSERIVPHTGLRVQVSEANLFRLAHRLIAQSRSPISCNIVPRVCPAFLFFLSIVFLFGLSVGSMPIYPSSKLHIQSLNSNPNQFSILSLPFTNFSSSHRAAPALLRSNLPRPGCTTCIGLYYPIGQVFLLSPLPFALSLALIFISLPLSSDFFPNQPQQITIYEKDIPPI